MKLNKYIEVNIIDEYATKNILNGYELNVSDLPANELSNLIDKLVTDDEVTKDFILDRIQDLIDERLPLIEMQDRYEAGYRPTQDQGNGEITWIKRI